MKEKKIYRNAQKLGVKYVVVWCNDSDGELIVGITDIQRIDELITAPAEFEQATVECVPEKIHHFIEKNHCDTFFVSSDGAGIAYSKEPQNYSSGSVTIRVA